MSPEERKAKVKKLRETHQEWFSSNNLTNALYIPKMAYRPTGKDDLHVSFFPSELEKSEDIYTEFVSIDYESEDPKRTLYLHRYNPHWKDEYEMITSSSGFQRHIIPVSELKVINDVTSRSGSQIIDFANPNLPNPDENIVSNDSKLIDKLEDINQSIITLTKVINKLIK